MAKSCTRNCPPAYRPALERLLPYAASLNYSYMVPDESIVEFWREYLRGIPESHDIPLDRPRSKEYSGATGTVAFDVDAAASEKVRALCGAHSITPEIFFLACLSMLVWKHSTQETVVIGTPYASREQEEVQGLFGSFIRTVPVRFDVDGTLDTVQWLRYVKDQYAKAWAHTSIGPDDLIDLSSLPCTAGINPIYQIVFSYNGPVEGPGGGNDATDSRVTQYDLSLSMKDSGSFEGVIAYPAELFDAETMKTFAANYVRVVRALCVHKGTLEQCRLMDAQGWETLKRTNMTDVPSYLGRTFTDLFRESADAYRDREAVITEDGAVLTYGDLDALSDGIAHKLAAAGTGTGGRHASFTVPSGDSRPEPP